MKAVRLFFIAAFLAAVPACLFAQTNNDFTPSAPSAAPAGPVVMPPSDTASPAVPADQSAPAVAPSSSGAPVPGTIVNPPTSSNPGQDDIADIRPPLFFLISWWPWILAALGLLALIGLVLLIWKWASRRRVMSPKTAYDQALEQLERARALMREDDPTPYAVAVSETIRTYLGQRFHSPSDRRTTEEFLRQMQEDTRTPLAEHAELLGAFLRACDLVKFARYQPTLAELEEVQQRAVNFVTATRPVADGQKSPGALTPAVATS
jgi:hypothetical protein